MAMVVDLRLHVPGLTPNYPKPSKEYFRKDRQAATMKPRTLEERRTFLGCFYLTSVYVQVNTSASVMGSPAHIKTESQCRPEISTP